jgi:caffeoyl-CoA O-methyltransferase
MQWIKPQAENYSSQYTSPTDNVLQKIYEDTVANHPMHQMISGPVQGKLLEFISTLIKPKYILEIGTFTGYSAICLAKGLQPGGQLHTIELRPEDANTAWKNIVLSGMNEKIRLHTGNAIDIIPALDYNWDIIFIDADKTGYTTYYNMVLPRLSKGGLIIADNVLFHGDVLDEEIKGKNAKAIHAFNKHVLADESTEQILLTVRDGLMFIKKK